MATVSLYGLTAVPVARRLGVVRPARSRPLLVGGDPWVVDLGVALRAAGLEVLMWAGEHEQRERIGHAGIELASGEMLAATGRSRRAGGCHGGVLPHGDSAHRPTAREPWGRSSAGKSCSAGG
ncbi:hypothetical protein [Streptomyces sp. NPDC005799]|uniref:hypothetical protein n=1 Tax=Streptomyces sp. NPDC005799 TaxID=3154678 RepID=UPI0033EF8A96